MVAGSKCYTGDMTYAGIFLLGLSTALFVAAGSAAKSWAISHESSLLLVLTLSLYTAGNLVVLRLIRDYGLGIAISLSAVVQVLIVNVIAFGIFGERISVVQACGVALATLSIALIIYPK